MIVVGVAARGSLAAEPSAGELLQNAKQSMAAGQFDRAGEAYKAAEGLLPDRPELAYNQGVAQYRKGDYDRAASCFGKALGGSDRALDAKAKFNLGNCAYAKALKLRESDPEKTLEQLRQALMHYRDAIEADPKDGDARANLELAGALLKQLQQQKEQQEKQQGKDQKKDQQKQPQSQPSSQPSSQPESQPESQPSSQPEQGKGQQNKGEKGEQQQGQQGQQQEGAQDGQQKNATPEKGKLESQSDQKDGKDKQDQQPMPVPTTQQAMTPEELERLLQLVRDRERQRMMELRRGQRGQGQPVEKDW